MKYNLTINPPKCYWLKKEGSQPKWPNPKYNWGLLILSTRLASIWVKLSTAPSRADPVVVFPLCRWWSFLFAHGAHHKKPQSPPPPPPPPQCKVWCLGTSVRFDALTVWGVMPWECEVWYFDIVRCDALPVWGLMPWRCKVWWLGSMRCDAIIVWYLGSVTCDALSMWGVMPWQCEMWCLDSVIPWQCEVWCLASLTHWGRVTHICVGNLTIIGSDNGLSPERCQAIIWTKAGILLIGPLGTNFSEILIEIRAFPFKKMHLNMSGKWRTFCLGLNVLRCDALAV